MANHLIYQIRVIGQLWGTGRAGYTYTSNVLLNSAAVRSLAGDFRDVDDYEITKIERGGSWENSYTKRNIVRPWENPEDAQAFFDIEDSLMGGV